MKREREREQVVENERKSEEEKERGLFVIGRQTKIDRYENKKVESL